MVTSKIYDLIFQNVISWVVGPTMPHLPQNNLTEIRHRLVHGYDSVDWVRVRKTLRNDLPPLPEKNYHDRGYCAAATLLGAFPQHRKGSVP